MQYLPKNTIDKMPLICERINRIRKNRGMSQKQFAVALDISQSGVSKYLKQRIPPAEILFKIATLGQTTMEYILTGEKTYDIIEENLLVSENINRYNTPEDLHGQIAQLPYTVRTAILSLIDYWSNHCK